MSNPQEKIKNSRRRYKDEVAIQKQVGIAKSKGVLNHPRVKEPHRLSKHHALDCGNPECFVCGNPRKTHKDKLTVQEKRLYQDLDSATDKHSNGASSLEDE